MSNLSEIAEMAQWVKQNRHLLETARWVEQNFYLPEAVETARLVAELQASTSREADTLTRYLADQTFLQSAAESMRTPWLDVQDPLRSMGGFAALQSIGHALKDMPAYGHTLGAALRVNLGDWRDRITWPREIFTDYEARADFYVRRGFNPALTNFPAPAFEESLHIADLRREPPTLVDLYGSPVPATNDGEEEAGRGRTNRAHDWIFCLETQVRRFIDEQMTKEFGPDWPKRQLPNGLYGQWQEKKRKAQQSGRREHPLIAYADFTDYVRVICKKDNWRNVFAPFFGREPSVRESFQRLYPVRLDTMHARPVTQSDELLLYVETRHLCALILGKEKS